MQEDNTYENTNIDEALTAMVNAFSRVAPDLNTLQHGMIAHLYDGAKYQLLGRILHALNLVDSDSFTMIRDSIEMEYDRRIRDGEMSDEFYKSIKPSSDKLRQPITLHLDHSIENRPKDMHPFKHEYFQAVLVKHKGLRIWYGKHGLTLEVITSGEKAQLTWDDSVQSNGDAQ